MHYKAALGQDLRHNLDASQSKLVECVHDGRRRRLHIRKLSLQKSMHNDPSGMLNPDQSADKYGKTLTAQHESAMHVCFVSGL